MGLIDLKTNLKSLKYGSDRQGGGSSNQPYIVTDIPDGYASKSQDFLLRDGRLNFLDSAQDVSRLTQFFADTKSPGGLLFTLKQEALERQNPKMVNTDRIYLPTSTIAQAGVLSIGAHLNKQGLDPLVPGYFTLGASSDGYFKYTKNQELGPGRLENRLTIAYTSKILGQPLGEFAINPFGVTGPVLNTNLLTYTGGPNSILGFGNTNIRIQNPTQTIRNIPVEETFARSYVSSVENSEGYLKADTKTPHINYVYNLNDGVSGTVIQLLGVTEVDLYGNVSTDSILNKNLWSFPSNPTLIQQASEYVGEVSNVVDPATGNKIIQDWNYNPSADITAGVPTKGASLEYRKLTNDQVSKDDLFLNVLTGGTDRSTKLQTTDESTYTTTQDLIDHEKATVNSAGTAVKYEYDPYADLNTVSNKYLARTNQSNADTNQDIFTDNSINLFNRDTSVPLPSQDILSQPKPLKTDAVTATDQGVNVETVYNPSISSSGLSDAYIKEFSEFVNRDNFFGDSLVKDNISTGLTGPTTPQKTLNSINPIYALTYQKLAERQSIAKPDSSNALSDFRLEATDADGNAYPGPSTNYSEFNRETTYGTSATVYKANVPSNPNESTGRFDKLNILDIQKSDASGSADLVSFYFKVINNAPGGANDFLFFRAYINSLGDGYQADWQSYKYVGRAENFYKYNGFSRDVSLSFTVYAHSRDEMIPIYNKINRLVGTTAPDYSGAGYMRGNFIRLTVGDYLNNVPGIIKNINLKPSFEGGWDINRREDGKLFSSTNGPSNVGQLPRLIDIDLSFTPIHDFTPQIGEKFIRNI